MRQEYCKFEPKHQPEEIWQFSRRRYQWAKDQWPNLSDRITTVWTLQDFGLISTDIDINTVVSVADNRQQHFVKVTTKSGSKSNPDDEISKEDL